MENFKKSVRKYKREIAQLEKDNAALEKKAAASENARKGKMLATSQLQADYYNLQRFVDALPEEIKRQAQQPQKSQTQQR